MNKKITHFTDLDAWRRGHELVMSVYEATSEFPEYELYGLTSQMRRCAISITSNIAEGFGRRTLKDKARFYTITQGSLTELQNQIIIARDRNYFSRKIAGELYDQTEKIQKIVYGMLRYLNRREQ